MNELNLIIFDHDCFSDPNEVTAKLLVDLSDEQIVKEISNQLYIPYLSLRDAKVYYEGKRFVRVEWDKFYLSEEELKNLMNEYLKD